MALDQADEGSRCFVVFVRQREYRLKVHRTQRGRIVRASDDLGFASLTKAGSLARRERRRFQDWASTLTRLKKILFVTKKTFTVFKIKLTCFHLATINFFVQIHNQLLEHLIRNQLKLTARNLQMLINLNATLFRDDQMLSAL